MVTSEELQRAKMITEKAAKLVADLLGQNEDNGDEVLRLLSERYIDLLQRNLEERK